MMRLKQRPRLGTFSKDPTVMLPLHRTTSTMVSNTTLEVVTISKVRKERVISSLTSNNNRVGDLHLSLIMVVHLLRSNSIIRAQVQVTINMVTNMTDNLEDLLKVNLGGLLLLRFTLKSKVDTLVNKVSMKEIVTEDIIRDNRVDIPVRDITEEAGTKEVDIEAGLDVRSVAIGRIVRIIEGQGSLPLYSAVIYWNKTRTI